MKRMVTILVGIIMMCSVTACGSQAEPANYVETESSQSMVEAKTSETIQEEVPAETPATTQWWMHVERFMAIGQTSVAVFTAIGQTCAVNYIAMIWMTRKRK